MIEFFHIFVIKNIDIYFGYKNKVYVINKQLMHMYLETMLKGM
jgi:hypothetical protein